MPTGKPVSIEVHDEVEGRFVVATYANGEVTRTFVDPQKTALRKPRRPIARAKFDSMNKTKRKRF